VRRECEPSVPCRSRCGSADGLALEPASQLCNRAHSRIALQVQPTRWARPPHAPITAAAAAVLRSRGKIQFVIGTHQNTIKTLTTHTDGYSRHVHHATRYPLESCHTTDVVSDTEQQCALPAHMHVRMREHVYKMHTTSNAPCKGAKRNRCHSCVP
jgi:hypothetical protein